MLDHNVSLTDKSTMQTVSQAKLYAEIRSLEELKETLTEIEKGKTSLPPVIIGQGSNIVFSSSVERPVIKNCIGGIKILPGYFKDDIEWELVEIGSGVLFEDFITFCLENGLYGAENLVGIPGTAGAAVIGNIGAYGTEQSDFFYSADAYDIKTGKTVSICVDPDDKEHMKKISEGAEPVTPDFSYRNSNLRELFILKVRYKLSHRFVPNLNYEGLQYPGKGKSPVEIAAFIRAVRNEKLPDYKVTPNAGSYFKNPIVPFEMLEKIINRCGMLKCYPSNIPGKVKLSAAQLIEIAGLKGLKTQKCGISSKHSLIIVNFGGASGDDILHLEKIIIREIKDKCGIELTPEVRMI